MENLHLKNLDIEKLLSKANHYDLLNDEDEDDDDDNDWEWTEEDDEDMKYLRREQLLMKLMYIIPIIMWIILIVAIIHAR